MPEARLDGVTVIYETAGTAADPSAPAVVFIHALGQNRHSYAAQTAAVSRHFRTLAFDLPGAGQSPHDPAGYSIPRWASQVDALTRHVGFDGKLFLVGHSMGTVTAMKFAVDQPDRVTGLVLIGALTGPAPGLVERARKVDAEGTASVVDAVLAGQLTAGTREGNPALTGLVRSMLSANQAVPYAGHCRALETFSIAPDLPRIKAPTLLLVGDADSVTPLKAQLGYRAAIGPHAKIAVIPGAAHTPQVERPDLVNARLLEFLIGA